MSDTLYDGDFLLMLRSWLIDRYDCGDIVVISKDTYHNGDFIIKRIIAVEGQEVDIDNETGNVYVDGVQLEEEYVSSLTFSEDEISFPMTVEKNCYFVLGDNREDSIDSRSTKIGLIHKDEIQGKAVFLLFPSSHGENSGFWLGRMGCVE